MIRPDEMIESSLNEADLGSAQLDNSNMCVQVRVYWHAREL